MSTLQLDKIEQLQRKMTTLPMAKEKSSLGRSSERKNYDLPRWKSLQEEANLLYDEVINRVGFYLEFLDYLTSSSQKGQSPIRQSRVSFKAGGSVEKEYSDTQLIETVRILKDVTAKINEKANSLEQRVPTQIQFEFHTSESYFEHLKNKLELCTKLKDVSEQDILKEIEDNLDVNKEEVIIDAFVKEKKGEYVNLGEAFSLYKLKAKVMNEKIDKIRSQFENQSHSVDQIRQIFDQSITHINLEIEELKQVATIDNSQNQKQQQIQVKKQKEAKLLDLTKKQDKMEQQIELILKEIQAVKEYNTKNSNTEILDEIGKAQEQLLQQLKQNDDKHQKITNENAILKKHIEDLKSSSQQLEQKASQLNSLISEQTKLRDSLNLQHSEESLAMQSQITELQSQVSKLESESQKLKDQVSTLAKENEELKKAQEEKELKEVPMFI